TNNPAFDCCAVWSADGKKLAFQSTRDDGGELYVMNADGSGHLNLTNNPAADGGQAATRDATKRPCSDERRVRTEIAARKADGNREAYVMNADGSAVTRLTNNPAVDWCADWSPDGTKLAFFTNRDGNAEIYVMNADGSGQLNLTNNPAADGGQAATRCASWRP